jgi:DNA mismatch repair protein MutS
MNANLAQLDCLCSFTQLAIENKYVCPELDETFNWKLKRKACYRKIIPVGMPILLMFFLDRNTAVDYDYRSQYVWKVSYFASNRADCTLITNGKFCPCRKREWELSIRYLRVGASDNISMGESTFMVEMNETASFLNNISDRSLVLFLERGTSTYDGISIA